MRARHDVAQALGEELGRGEILFGGLPIASGGIAIPATCSGSAPLTLFLQLSFVGINGETATVQQRFHN